MKLASVLILLAVGTSGFAQQNPNGLVRAGTARVNDLFTPFQSVNVRLNGGMLGDRLDANVRGRLLHVDEEDLLNAFEHREVPHQDWQGEHVGKFLHAACLAWNYGHDASLRQKIDRVAARLMATQEADGYLGTYLSSKRWTSWDVWVHKYDLLGLLAYYQFTGSKRALEACRRIGDLLCKTFGTSVGQRDINKAGEHVGMAADSVLEPMTLLYRATGESRYLNFSRYIVANYDAPGGPEILSSIEKTQSVLKVGDAKAYEMISNFNGLVELYRSTGTKRLIDDMETAWNDIVANRLYITGSGSSDEVWQDQFHLPNDPKSDICETCVTVTWEQMNLQMLRLTGDPKYADQAELSIYNHLLAAQKPNGEAWAYYTPLEGTKPYSAATTCCLSSGPRGIALIPSIAYMTSADGGLVVNLYNPGEASADLPGGPVRVAVESNYPFSGDIRIHIQPRRAGMRFSLRLRIPAWTVSAKAQVDAEVFAARPGSYLVVDRKWGADDQITLRLNMSPRVVVGDHENAGKLAWMVGPLVLAFEGPNATQSQFDFNKAMKPHYSPRSDTGRPAFVLVGDDSNPQAKLPTLVPFADAGRFGDEFSVWLTAKQ